MMRVFLLSEGGTKSRASLGNKGAQLAEMKQLHLPVPPGMIITTEAWREYQVNRTLPDDLKREIAEKLKAVEDESGKVFGARSDPLLVSVRSGAPASMPGMLDTILNLGLNDVTVVGLAEQAEDERFAYECYQRFVSSFARIAFGMQGDGFRKILEEWSQRSDLKSGQNLPLEALKAVVAEFKALVEKETGKRFPDNVHDQLLLAVGAVFDSWFTERAITYRQGQNIPNDLGTAVIVQSMVFGNRGNDSGTGVLFTRDPSTGEKKLYGEFLVNAQGEDLVAGIRTPEPIDALSAKLPEIYDQLVRLSNMLEKHFRDMQDVEFTIEKGKLYVLQTRDGKRTPQASARIAFDMYKDGIISREDALRVIRSIPLQELTLQQKDSSIKLQTLAKGLPASPGIATGSVVFSSNEAVRLKEEGKRVILVRPHTSPEDIRGILASEGVVTARGGMTSHAAVITRGLSKPCVVGCEGIEIDVQAARFHVRKGQAETVTVAGGDVISIDGTEGLVILGEMPKVVQSLSEYVKELLA
jgi:pyruvate,orthophosphate dikinase